MREVVERLFSFQRMPLPPLAGGRVATQLGLRPIGGRRRPRDAVTGPCLIGGAVARRGTTPSALGVTGSRRSPDERGRLIGGPLLEVGE